MFPRNGSKREYKEKAMNIIIDLLEEEPFMMRRSVQVLLEDYNIYHTITAHAIEELESIGRIRTAKYPKRGAYPLWIYREELRLNDIRGKISNEYLPLHKKFSDKSDKMGRYAEKIVEKALKEAGFIIVSREGSTQYFDGEEYPEKNDLDFIALKDMILLKFGCEILFLTSIP